MANTDPFSNPPTEMSLTTVDLNADCGESFGPWTMGDDRAILQVVTTANVACGFHAGDPDTMLTTVEIAKENGVSVGAHPGFADLAGFGRRHIAMSAAEITRMVAYQIGAVAAVASIAGVKLSHVKAHGALSNVAMADKDVADAIAAAVQSVDSSLTLLAIATTELERAGREHGLSVAAEVFADRAYEPNGELVSRKRPGAVIHDPEDAARRVIRMVEENAIIAEDGTRIRTHIDSICVHGDNPDAVATARTVRAALEKAGVRIAPLAQR